LAKFFGTGHWRVYFQIQIRFSKRQLAAYQKRFQPLQPTRGKRTRVKKLPLRGNKKVTLDLISLACK
jgi:hypothetical protein